MARRPMDLPKQYPFLARASRRGRTQGSVLFLTLWALCFLAALGVILGTGIRQKLTLVYRLDEREKLRLIAEAGIKKGIMWLHKEEATGFNALKDPWSNNAAAFKDVFIGDGKFNICYNVSDESGNASVRYGLIDEERKININVAQPGVLKRLFQAVLHCDVMEAQELAACIVDWRDKDSELSIPVGSAEDSYYANLENPYRIKNAPFEVKEELLLVKGMRKDIYVSIQGYVTIYGDGRVNINTASKPVLLALGLSVSLADKITEFRRGADLIEGTPDDNIFGDASTIVNTLKKVYPCNDKEVAELTLLAERYLSTSSSTFTVISNAQLRNKKNTDAIACVVDREGNMLRWEES